MSKRLQNYPEHSMPSLLKKKKTCPLIPEQSRRPFAPACAAMPDTPPYPRKTDGNV